MLHATLGRELGNIRGQESKGVVRVALVLGEVKRHTADEPPLGIALAQISLQSSRMLLDLVADKRVELRPPGEEDLGAQVFAPWHRRGLQYLKRQVCLGRRSDERDHAALGIPWRLAEPREIQAGKIASVGKGRGQARR